MLLGRMRGLLPAAKQGIERFIFFGKHANNQRCTPTSKFSTEAQEFDETLYRNELHVIGRAVRDPTPRYYNGVVSGDKDDILGYHFLIDVPTQQKQMPVRCTVMAYTFPDKDTAEFVSSNVRKGQMIEIFGFLRKIVKSSGTGDIPNVIYSIGPKTIRIMDEEMHGKLLDV